MRLSHVNAQRVCHAVTERAKTNPARPMEPDDAVFACRPATARSRESNMPPCCASAAPEPGRMGRCHYMAQRAKCRQASKLCPVACGKCTLCAGHALKDVYAKLALSNSSRRTMPSRKRLRFEALQRQRVAIWNASLTPLARVSNLTALMCGIGSDVNRTQLWPPRLWPRNADGVSTGLGAQGETAGVDVWDQGCADAKRFESALGEIGEDRSYR